MDSLDLVPAPALRRVLALAVDACIGALVYLVLDLAGAHGARMFMFFLFGGWLCLAVPAARLGASPGMRVAGLKVTDLKGRKPRIVRASCRVLLSLLSTGLFGMGFMLFFLTRKRQTLHEMFTNTLVLDARANQVSGQTAPDAGARPAEENDAAAEEARP